MKRDGHALDFSAWLIIVGLAIVTFAAYSGVSKCGFVNLDDDAYVEFAPMVNQGLRGASVAWAFTAAHSNNWHPLTSLSHMLDCDVFGVRPGPMHIENVCWHALNAILVFLIWRRMTGTRWRAAFVAGLFALHPLHVESVAWISERKDVLSAFFLLLSIYAYVGHARIDALGSPRPGVRGHAKAKGPLHNNVPPIDDPHRAWFRCTRSYWLAVSFFVLASLCKPMVVTLPVLLLLLDFWPLRRTKTGDGGAPPRGRYALLLEKLPFFAVAIIVAFITLMVQFHTGAAAYGARIALSARAENAVVSYARYLEKTFWPVRLSVFYHHPGYWPPWVVVLAVGIASVLSIAALWQWRRRPWIAFGWLWFVISLLPVIGLIQVGAQAMADRYTYIPLLGVFTIIGWAMPLDRVAADAKKPKWSIVQMRLAAGVVIVVLGVCLGLTRQQVQAWRNSISLYQHSIAMGEDNATVRYLLGSALQASGAPESDVLAEYGRALELDPTYVNALTQLAVAALNHGNIEQCRKLIERTLELEPRNPALHKNLGAFYVRTGRPEQGIPHFETALKLDPKYADAHHELAWIDLQQNKLEPAIHELQAVVRVNPWDTQALYELGDALARVGRVDEARRKLERVLWIQPSYAEARDRLRALK